MDCSGQFIRSCFNSTFENKKGINYGSKRNIRKDKSEIQPYLNMFHAIRKLFIPVTPLPINSKFLDKIKISFIFL